MSRPIKEGGGYDEEAHKLFVKGAREQNPLSKQKLEASLDALEQAVKLNSEYARAKGELAYTKVVAAISGHFDSDAQQLLREADVESEQVLRMEWGKNDYQSYWNRAFYLTNCGDPDRYEEGLREYETAKNLFKSHTDPMDRRSGLFIEYAEAIISNEDAEPKQIEKAFELIDKAMTPPVWYFWVKVFALYETDRFNEAHETILEMEDKYAEILIPFPVKILKSIICEKLGDHEGCKSSMEQFSSTGQSYYRNLKSYSGDDIPLEPHAVEKVFLAEFETSGFKDDGKSRKSRAWRDELIAAMTRAENNLLKSGFDVDWVKSEFLRKFDIKVP